MDSLGERKLSGPSPLETGSLPSARNEDSDNDNPAPEPAPATSPTTAGMRSPYDSISTGPGGDWGPLSPDTADRVFPIRSVVNIEPVARSASPGSVGGSVSAFGMSYPDDEQRTARFFQNSFHEGRSRTPSNSTAAARRFSPRSSVAGQAPSRPELASAASEMGGSVYSDAPEGQESDQESSPSGVPPNAFITARHKHVQTAEGHMVVTGVDGAEQMQRCEDEPIHIPGAVQGFGCLVALKEQEDGTLIPIIVSENSAAIIGYTPGQLFGLTNFCTIMSEEQAENLYDHIEFIHEDGGDTENNGPEVFSLIITAPDSTQTKLWCALHVPKGSADMLICEFELEDDQKFPLTNMTEDSPPPPEDTLGANPTETEVMDSTLSMSKPLRVLRHARKRRGEAAAMEVFNLMTQIQEQLASAPNIEVFLKVVVGVVKELTGFHRVMIYQFDEAWNGQVVSELVDYRATKDLYKGLHFPASDIPAQARALYQLNKVRLLYDRDQQTARLVCRSREDLENPLDLTHSYLRAMSPIHLKYLGNMGVRSSMSISITAFEQLWGLISCHGYGGQGMRVSFPIRKMCRLIGDTTSRNIERLSYARRLQARKLINTVPTEQNPGGYIVASSDDLLKLFDADFGLLSIKNETKILGKLENSQEALALLEYLRMRNFSTVITSRDLRETFPDLKYGPGFQVIAGLLLVPLTSGGSDFIVFFRRGQLKHVHWAGNPYEKNMKHGTNAYLEPRKSFKLWSETVVGKSREWTEEQVETGAVLCLVYGKFIEVWRQKEAAIKNSQLTRLLLANASHEVRTPLNAIINYLEIALEGPLDRETRDNLSRSHTASKSLIYVINDLLDLTRTEGGHALTQDEDFNLKETIIKATKVFNSDAERKRIGFEIIEYPGLPTVVKGDSARLRQIVSNITGNAMKHTNEGGVKIELYGSPTEDGTCEVEIAIQDTGVGMSPSKVDALFREFEQVQGEDELEQDHLSSSASFDALSRIPGQKILGLGLAVVVRTIRILNGQLRLKSEEGRGSRFTVRIPFGLPSDSMANETVATSDSDRGRAPTPLSTGEVMLVDNTRPPSRPSMEGKRQTSAGSQSSLLSQRSGSSARSEIDRLVDAISTPYLIDQKPPHRSQSQEFMPSSSSPVASSTMARSSSTGAVETAMPSPKLLSPGPGQEYIEGSGMPLKAVKVPTVAPSNVPSGSCVAPQNIQRHDKPKSLPSAESEDSGDRYQILVAEDDPINSKIMKKRLERMKHIPTLTVNGEECLEVFSKNSDTYDAVLMDMQMPIMDGGTCTTQIREKEGKNPNEVPAKHTSNGRIPIFAVSASLVEGRREEYMSFGFDGWILKPIDFKRLETLLAGIQDAKLRKDAEYVPGQWEQGGWFCGDQAPGKESVDITPAALKSQGKDPKDI